MLSRVTRSTLKQPNAKPRAIIQSYIKRIFIAHLYLMNKFDSVRARDFTREVSLKFDLLALGRRRTDRRIQRDRHINISILSSITAREAGRVIKRPKRRLSRLLRASPNILIPDARNTRCGSFFKMLPVLRANVGHLHNLNRHLREVCAGFIRADMPMAPR